MSHTIHLKYSEYVTKNSYRFYYWFRKNCLCLHSSALFEEEKIILKPYFYFYTQLHTLHPLFLLPILISLYFLLSSIFLSSLCTIHIFILFLLHLIGKNEQVGLRSCPHSFAAKTILCSLFVWHSSAWWLQLQLFLILSLKPICCHCLSCKTILQMLMKM